MIPCLILRTVNVLNYLKCSQQNSKAWPNGSNDQYILQSLNFRFLLLPMICVIAVHKSKLHFLGCLHYQRLFLFYFKSLRAMPWKVSFDKSLQNDDVLKRWILISRTTLDELSRVFSFRDETSLYGLTYATNPWPVL